MDYEVLIDKIPNQVVTKRDIINVADSLGGNPNDATFRNLIDDLIDGKYIKRVSRNHYVKKSLKEVEGKKIYRGNLSAKSYDLINEVSSISSGIYFRVWELNFLNEFVNHLIGRNVIFLEVDKESINYVCSMIQENHKGDLLLEPTEKEIDYYLYGDIIVMTKLISEAPQNTEHPHEVPLEKIIVDLFSNKVLTSFISKADYPEALEKMFDKYIVDQNKLFRYARRRGKSQAIKEFIANTTNIQLDEGIK